MLNKFGSDTNFKANATPLINCDKASPANPSNVIIKIAQIILNIFPAIAVFLYPIFDASKVAGTCITIMDKAYTVAASNI